MTELARLLNSEPLFRSEAFTTLYQSTFKASHLQGREDYKSLGCPKDDVG